MSFDYEQSIWGKGTASLAWSSPTHFRLLKALNTLAPLPSGAKVLEIGCGAGQFIRAIRQKRPELQCYGTDISQEAIQKAEQYHDQVTYRRGEAERLPFDAGEFSAVLIFDVLEHVVSPENFLAEVNRVLRPGGMVYAFVPCEGDALSLWYWLDIFHLKRNLTTKYAGHIHFFSRRELFRLYQQTGFSIKRVWYSEHILGQLLGVIAFMLMDRAVGQQGGQINNETYFAGASSRTVLFLKKIINAAVALESHLLSPVPSPNVHVKLTKAI